MWNTERLHFGHRLLASVGLTFLGFDCWTLGPLATALMEQHPSHGPACHAKDTAAPSRLPSAYIYAVLSPALVEGISQRKKLLQTVISHSVTLREVARIRTSFAEKGLGIAETVPYTVVRRPCYGIVGESYHHLHHGHEQSRP